MSAARTERAGPVTAMEPAERRTLLATLGFMSFASVYAHVVVIPVLVVIGGEFGISPGAAGLLVAGFAVPGIVIPVIAGPYSDRFGRKIFLTGGSALMGIATLGSAVAGSFELIVLTRALAGIGASLTFPNVNATIGDTFPYRERGKAISTVIAMNTLATIAGIPIAGIVAEATSWRVSVALVGTLALVASLALLWLLPNARPHGDERRARALYKRVVTDVSALGAISSSFMGALFWFTWGTFLVLFFQSTFALSVGQASTVALTLELGTLVGSQVGGRLGDRIGHKPIVAGGIVIAGALLLALTNVPMSLAVAAALNLVLSAVIGARFATNIALLTEQVPEARGTLLSISSSVVSVGIVVGASIGGVLVDGPGFGALGVFCAAVALVSGAIVVAFVTEEPIGLETI